MIPIINKGSLARRRSDARSRRGSVANKSETGQSLQFEPLERRELLAVDLELGLPLEPAGGPSADWVDALYSDTLGRHASNSETQYWSSLIDSGVGRDTIAQAILTSREARSLVVADFYEDYLGRAVDPAGLDFWLGIWAATGGPDVVNAALIGSQEFYAANGSTSRGAIQGLYNELLGRYAADAEVDYWKNVIATTPLASVALGFIRSDEYRFGLADQWYQDYLNRPIDLSSGLYWVWRMNTGLSQDQVQAALIGSAEYSSLSSFYVADYGATGDGVTNDSAAIQAAFDAAKAAGGGRVVFGKPTASYLIGTTVTVDNAENIVVDATEAVFTERTTDGVADLLESFYFVDSQNISWRGGRVQGSEYQGTSVTHGGVSTGYHAWMAAKILQTPSGLPTSETPVFLRMFQTNDAVVEDLHVEGRLVGLNLYLSKNVTVRGFRFQGFLDGTFRKETGQDASDRLAERWAIKTNEGISIVGGADFLVEDVATVNDDSWYVGSFLISSPSSGLPQNVSIRDFNIGAFQDHALYLSSDYTTAEYGAIRGRDGQGGTSLEFRVGSHNVARDIHFEDVNIGIQIPHATEETDYSIHDNVMDRVAWVGIKKVAGKTTTGLDIRRNSINTIGVTGNGAIKLQDVQSVTLIGNFIVTVPKNDGISLTMSSGTSSGNEIRGNSISGASRGIVVSNVTQSQFVSNVGDSLSGGSAVNTVLHFENTTNSVIASNVNTNPSDVTVYVPSGTSWSNNQLIGNVGLLDINS